MPTPLPPSLRRRPIVAAALVFLCTFQAFGAAPGPADPASTLRNFDVPEGTAGRTLRLFAQQANREIIFSLESVGTTKTNAVAGRLPPQAALDRMLANTGLVFSVEEKSGAFAVRPGATPEKNVPRAETPASRRPNPNDLSPAADTVTLSPFVVATDAERGYQASSTLAGTRLNTPLADLGSPISAYTKEFLSDTNVTNVNELFVYTLSTEGAGLAGNYSATTVSDNFAVQEDSRRNPQTSNRVRGLVAADVTRDFFLTSIPMNSYNVDRVDISRGPNAILFGLGSPAGVVNGSLVKPLLNRNAFVLEQRYGDHNSFRNVADANLAIIPQKFAGRFVVMNDEKHWEQKPTFERDNRAFVAFKAMPFASTTISAHYEDGSIKSRRPLTISPLDGGLSTWFLAGKPTWNGSQPVSATNPNPIFPATIAPPLDIQTIVLANPGFFWQWALPFEANGQAPSMAGLQGRRPVPAVPGGPNVTLEFFGPRAISDFSNTLRRPGIPIGVFDYRHQLLSGEVGYTKQSFRSPNITLEQHFLDHRIGVELAYSKETYSELYNEPFGSGRTNPISLDVNTVLMDGRTNPNFGRPFIKSWESGVRTDQIDNDAFRATGYARFDAADHFRSGVGRWLGRHTMTGFFSRHTRDQDTRTTKQGWVGGNAAFDLNETNIVNQRRNVVDLIYVGPSLANFTSLNQVHLAFNPTARLAQPGDTYDITYWDRTGFAWRTGKFRTVEGIAAATLRHQTTDSTAAILQSYWLKDALVTVVGWRRDDLESFVSSSSTGNQFASGDLQGSVDMSTLRLPGAPTFTSKGDIWTSSVVARLPKSIKRPFGVDPSLHYSQSENFQPGASGISIFGANLTPPSGKTKEYGISLAALDNRATIKLNWYETSLTNARSASTQPAFFSALMNVDFQTAQFWYQGIAERGAAAGVTQANIDRLIGTIPQSVLDLWGYKVITNPDGSKQPQYGNPTSLMADVANQVAKGLEIEAGFQPTSAWRVSINAAKSQARTSKSAAFAAEYIALRSPIWQELGNLPENPTSLTDPGLFTNKVNRLALSPLASIQSRDGTYSPELRKWRFNLINNYSFERDSRLRGVGIGGAYRWQDKAAIDYPLVNNGKGVFVADVSRPFFAPADTSIDLWISYRRAVFAGKAKWKLQLNVSNVFADDELIPATMNTDGTPAQYRVAPPRTWALTSTFTF